MDQAHKIQFVDRHLRLDVAWYLRYLAANPRKIRGISWGVAVCMFVEISFIVLQSARGTTSHFNNDTPLDASIFGVMGMAIVLNSLLVVWVLALFLRERPAIPPAYLWGIRLGLIIFLLASAEGGLMVGHQAHTVGASDGGPGFRLSTGAPSTAIFALRTSPACMRSRFFRWPVSFYRGSRGVRSHTR